MKNFYQKSRVVFREIFYFNILLLSLALLLSFPLASGAQHNSSIAQLSAQCSDGKDNDKDGKIDAADPGCSGPFSLESDDITQCSDGIDNDKDGQIDLDDPGCASVYDKFEISQCDDKEDNDLDGKTDFPADKSCSSRADNSEANQCGDGIDNDKDGFTDLNDPGCPNKEDDSEETQCTDNYDNDGDGLIDMFNDPGCTAFSDDDERNQCSDGVDNDGDGAIDFSKRGTGDPGCSSEQDNSEANQCQDGADNDGDGKIDFGFAKGANDPGCESFIDDDESDDLPQCSDKRDNEDSDSLVDMKDPGCSDPKDNDETSQCEDKIDNDNDGKTDFGQDPGCKSLGDDSEVNFRRFFKFITNFLKDMVTLRPRPPKLPSKPVPPPPPAPPVPTTPLIDLDKILQEGQKEKPPKELPPAPPRPSEQEPSKQPKSSLEVKEPLVPKPEVKFPTPTPTPKPAEKPWSPDALKSSEQQKQPATTPIPTPTPTCVPKAGSCTAPTPACGETTTGLDSCLKPCSLTGPSCPTPTACVESWTCSDWSPWSVCAVAQLEKDGRYETGIMRYLKTFWASIITALNPGSQEIAASSQIRTRICSDDNKCGTTLKKPAVSESQSCTPPAPEPTAPVVQTCIESWSCGAWGECSSSGNQSRTCTDANSCGTTANKLAVSQPCTYTPPAAALVACVYTYSRSACDVSTQTVNLTVTGSSPAGCTGIPKTTDACTTQECLYGPNGEEQFWWYCDVSPWSTCVPTSATVYEYKTQKTSFFGLAFAPFFNQISKMLGLPPFFAFTGPTIYAPGTKTRTVSCPDTNNCGTQTGRPATTQSCTVEILNPQFTACCALPTYDEEFACLNPYGWGSYAGSGCEGI